MIQRSLHREHLSNSIFSQLARSMTVQRNQTQHVFAAPDLACPRLPSRPLTTSLSHLSFSSSPLVPL